jgi:hypothetical protein
VASYSLLLCGLAPYSLSPPSWGLYWVVGQPKPSERVARATLCDCLSGLAGLGALRTHLSAAALQSRGGPPRCLAHRAVRATCARASFWPCCSLHSPLSSVLQPRGAFLDLKFVVGVGYVFNVWWCSNFDFQLGGGLLPQARLRLRASSQQRAATERHSSTWRWCSSSSSSLVFVCWRRPPGSVRECPTFGCGLALRGFRSRRACLRAVHLWPCFCHGGGLSPS